MRNILKKISGKPSKKLSLPEHGFRVADILSSADSSVQKAYFYASKKDKPMPLVVQLHEWSCDYKIFPERPELGILCKNAGYNYIFPDFRGSNNTSDSCMSEKAIRDIDDAIYFAIMEGNADADNIAVIGASGGGHAALTMYLKSKHNVKYFAAWCPISDIEQWYYQTKYANLQYYKDIEQIVGDFRNIPEMRNRSPMYMDFAENIDRKNAKLEIYHGINDGYTGSVSSVHSLNFYNKLSVGEGGSIPDSDILKIVSRSIPGNSTEFIADRELLYKKETGNIGLYIFNGTHEMLTEYAFGRIKTFLP
jgi:pimeloyl-ACP methyl ester carboxylesterase